MTQGTCLDLFVKQSASFMQQNYKKYFGIQKRFHTQKPRCIGHGFAKHFKSAVQLLR